VRAHSRLARGSLALMIRHCRPPFFLLRAPFITTTTIMICLLVPFCRFVLGPTGVGGGGDGPQPECRLILRATMAAAGDARLVGASSPLRAAAMRKVLRIL
jgi:hypothetical protein